MNQRKKSRKTKSPSNQIAKSIPQISNQAENLQPPIGNQTLQNQQLQLEISRSIQGPIPAPEILKSYEEIQPGLASKIIEWAEQQKTHRHAIEIKGQEANIQEIKTGQNFGLIIGLVTVISGAITAINGAELAGGLIGTGGVAGLVATFVYGRKHK